MSRMLPALWAGWPGCDVAATLCLLILLAACGRPASSEAQPTPIESLSPPATAAPSPTPPGRENPAAPQGTIMIPSGVGDAGNFFLYAGSILTLTWEDPPAGAARYDFVLSAFESSETVVIGSDLDASDGVTTEWYVPEFVSGSLTGAAVFDDGRVIYSHRSADLYSGIAPPEGTCVLASGTIGALDVFKQPSDASPPFAILVPGEFAKVLERTIEGWYRIDASPAVDRDTGEPVSGMGWVDSRQSIVLFGPCDGVPVTGP